MSLSFLLPKRHVKTDGVFTKCRNCEQTVRIKEIEERRAKGSGADDIETPD